ncbi:sugar ABC transporter ATP-binding protein [Agrobacterium arsenijevicii]|uniref:D-ribose transporter ATP-binding protein n=1 Tax=Agrobacterium arsenijevicii TaxID=1585697 RepID=A0ABR5D6U5_9HYPH|nr:D-ribose transporter ATP-binding protein [Agrobacterium arsenijevicii]
MMQPIVQLSGLGKSFGGVKALKDVGLDIHPGEVHALMGENGAGKSTLIKILSGLYTPDEGTITVNGEAVTFSSTRDANAAGIATVYQELLLFPELTVAENIFLGNYPRRAGGIIDWPAVRSGSRKLLEELDTHDLDVDEKVANLSVAQRQCVEIAKALSKDAKVLIMDEPTASLVESDVQRLLDIVRQLRARGVGILYVSHRMPEIFAVCDRVTVLRDGAYVATKNIDEVDEGALVSLMVGRAIENLFPKLDVPIGKPILEVAALNHGKRVRDISFAVRQGEILGIAGLVGSGRTELALTLFGMTPATSGEIRIDGKAVAITSPSQARNLGIAYVPEDRGSQGLIKSMAIRKNVTMATLDKVSNGIFIRTAAEMSRAAAAIKRFGVRCRDPDQPIGQLSGGNQQKVVIAKWLEIKPRVLILDEPTRGVDVGAKSEIHAIMGELAREGVAIIMISSELPEVLGMSDRVMVMAEGRVTEILERSDATPERVGAAMTAHRREENAA